MTTGRGSFRRSSIGFSVADLKGWTLIVAALILSAVAAPAVPFIEVTSVATRASGGTRSVENGPTTEISGQVTQSAAAFDESTGFTRPVAAAEVRYLVDDLSLFVSTQVTTSGPPGNGESEVVITFTSSRPIIVEAERLVNQEKSDVFLNNTPLSSFRALAAGTYTIQLTADSSENNANLAMSISISEDPEGNPPPPPPPPPGPPGTLEWKQYAAGQWQQATRWLPERAPRADDKVTFDLLPDAALRSVPLVFIDVTSTAASAGAVDNLDISRSAVSFSNFGLQLAGSADEPDSLTIRNGGVLRVDAPAFASSPTQIFFETTRVAIGDGKKQVLGRGRVLGESRLEIGPSVVWKNTESLSVGERMPGTLLVQTRLGVATASESLSDVLLGVRPGSSGKLVVTGRFLPEGLLAGSRPRTFGSVHVQRGGLLVSSAAELASGLRASAF